MVRIYARNYRGFKNIDFEYDGTTFLVGDNSSGKSSIIHLLQYVLASELEGTPRFNEDFLIGQFDFFSPYFDNQPVTMGFETEVENIKTSRILTIKQRKNGPPEVLSFTVVVGNRVVTLRSRSHGVFGALYERETDWSLDDAIDIHDKQTGFQRINDDFYGSAINTGVAASIAIEYLEKNIDRDNKVAKVLFHRVLSGPRQMGSIRANPERFYKFDRKYEASGLHFATLWHDFRKLLEKNDKSRELLSTFGRESGLFEELIIKPVSRRIEGAPMTVSIIRNGKEFLINQVGIGVSQIIPIIIEVMFFHVRNVDVVFLLQQPELHLHPIAQAALGTLLHKLLGDDMHYIMETHSDYLIDSYRAAIRDADDYRVARILFCEASPEGNVASTIRIKADGKLDSPPDTYQSFFIKEMIRTMF